MRALSVAILAAPVAATAGPYAARTLFVESFGNPIDEAARMRATDPVGAAYMQELARHPVALWLGEWIPDVRRTVDDALDRAGGQLRVFVVYAVPSRDCGHWSDGGVSNATEYARFVSDVAAGLEGREAIVVLEPDGLALNTCLDPAAEAERHRMFADAVDTLTAAGGRVYLDAGDSNWIPAADMARRLISAGVHRAAGFALNVSHTELTENEIAYAEELRAIIGPDAHYVVDTSRNGLGPNAANEWCNPRDRAIGPRPTLDVDEDGLDALLWIKPPGESDGECNGGPPAGHWWPEYARELVEQAAVRTEG